MQGRRWCVCVSCRALDVWHGHLVGKIKIMIKMAIVVSS